jgi:hypothetical protein
MLLARAGSAVSPVLGSDLAGKKERARSEPKDQYRKLRWMRKKPLKTSWFEML